jgi:hypothetical protein
MLVDKKSTEGFEGCMGSTVFQILNQHSAVPGTECPGKVRMNLTLPKILDKSQTFTLSVITARVILSHPLYL